MQQFKFGNLVRFFRPAFLGLVLSVSSAAPGAIAQTPDTKSDLKREHDVLFAQVLRDPANIDVSFRYAEVATRLGDFEASIGALERILFYNPNLPRVKLELGLLYFRLGSYEMARSYFDAAVASPDTPFEVKNRVAGFQAEIDRRLQTTQASFYAQSGLRYQSNANAGPNSPLVKAFGFDAVLSRTNTKRPDWNWFINSSARLVYDFENQRGDVLEANVSGYLSRQFNIQRLNTGLIEANIGPRLAVHPDLLPGWSIKPYVIGGAVSLSDNPYLVSGGFGVSMAIPLVSVLLEPGYEQRYRSFRNSTEITNAREQNGRQRSLYINISGSILPEWKWQVRVAGNRVDASRDYNSYRSQSFDLALPYEFDAFGLSARKWTVAPFIGFTKTYYDQPNAVVDPNQRRKDKEWRVGASLDAPIWANAGIGMVVSYTNVKSDIRNYGTKNFSVTFGPTVRF